MFWLDIPCTSSGGSLAPRSSRGGCCWTGKSPPSCPGYCDDTWRDGLSSWTGESGGPGCRGRSASRGLREGAKESKEASSIRTSVVSNRFQSSKLSYFFWIFMSSQYSEITANLKWFYSAWLIIKTTHVDRVTKVDRLDLNGEVRCPLNPFLCCGDHTMIRKLRNFT